MRKFLRQKNRAFTLVETLVAISIFTVSILGLLSVLSSGISNTNYAKQKMTASYLAQEGIEYIRNMRDTFVLYDATDAQAGWNAFYSKLANASCQTNNGCYFDDQNLNYTDHSQPMAGIAVTTCHAPFSFNYDCPSLLYDATTGKYGYIQSANAINSGYIRKIVINQISLDEIKVSSTVFWNQGSGSYNVTFSEDLSSWMVDTSLPPPPPPPPTPFATGGTVTTSGLYTIHTFTSSGTFTVNDSGTVQVLVVAGGGSGTSGGGGAGGMLENNSYSVTPSNITVTVGAGGTVNNNNAGNSVFGTITATAGGRGQDTSGAGFNGGSGGGANATQNNHGTGIVGQGSNGGDAAGANGGGGGGGGGSAGSNGSGSSGGNGGGGRVSSISGSSVTYAGGGGAAGLTAGGGGGAGGGGNGGVNSSTAGAANYGGGGGGGWYVAGASGGSGIVIVRYLTP